MERAAYLIALVVLAVVLLTILRGKRSGEGYAASDGDSYYLVARENSIQAESGNDTIASNRMATLLGKGDGLLVEKRDEVEALEKDIREKLCSLEKPLVELRVRTSPSSSPDDCATTPSVDLPSWPTSVECAADYGTSRPCCGQVGTEVAPEHRCPAEAPHCKGYLHGKRWGSCHEWKGERPPCRYQPTDRERGYTRVDAKLLMSMARPAMFFMPAAKDKAISKKVFLAGVGVHREGGSLQGALGDVDRPPFYRVFSGPHEVVVTYKKHAPVLPARQVVIPPGKTDAYVWHWGPIEKVEVRFPRRTGIGTGGTECSRFPGEGVRLKLECPSSALCDDRFNGSYLASVGKDVRVDPTGPAWDVEVLSGNEVTLSIGNSCLTSREGDERHGVEMKNKDDPVSGNQRWTLYHNENGTFSLYQKSDREEGRDYLGYNRRDRAVQRLEYGEATFRVRLEPVS